MNSNITTTGEKGSDVYTFDGVGDPRVALSALLVRDQSTEIIKNGMDKILNSEAILSLDDNKKRELETDAYVMMFQTRNVRGGKGEREVGKYMYEYMYKHNKDLSLHLLELIPEYGYWQDVFDLYEKINTDEFKNKTYEIVKSQLEDDEKNMEEKKSVSLLAKWIPRQTRQENIAKDFAFKMFTGMAFSEKMKNYRKRIVKLNQYLNTVEILQCSKHWADIKPGQVPGRALKKYTKAFLNEKAPKKKNEVVEKGVRFPDDPDRVQCAENFKAHTKKVLEGKASVKAADVVMPNELWAKILKLSHGDVYGHSNYNTYDYEVDADGEPNTKSEVPVSSEDEKNIVRAQWLGIRNDLKSKGTFTNMVAMCDFSGSMSGTPLQVSASLGLLFTEVATGIGKNKMLSFDSQPQWIEFPETDDVFEKAKVIMGSNYGQGLSTDFQKAMEMIIADLKKNKTPIDQAPTDLVVFTDMAWDAACGSSGSSIYTGNRYRHHVKTDTWQTHIEMIRESFKRAGEDNFGEGQGYTMPRIVIWNLRDNTMDFHAKADTPGVLMFSGWSPSLFKYLVKDGFRVQTPYDGLRAQLDDPIYNKIREKINEYYEKK